MSKAEQDEIDREIQLMRAIKDRSEEYLRRRSEELSEAIIKALANQAT